RRRHSRRSRNRRHLRGGQRHHRPRRRRRRLHVHRLPRPRHRPAQGKPDPHRPPHPHRRWPHASARIVHRLIHLLALIKTRPHGPAIILWRTIPIVRHAAHDRNRAPHCLAVKYFHSLAAAPDPTQTGVGFSFSSTRRSGHGAGLARRMHSIS